MDIPRNREQIVKHEKESAKRREAVKSAYPSDKWVARVARMDDNQVIAVYMRLRSQGKI